MSNPVSGVFHDPIAQANLGLYPSPGVFPKSSTIGLLSFGFLWGNIWAPCDMVTTDSWAGCSMATTATFTACGFSTGINWGDC